MLYRSYERSADKLVTSAFNNYRLQDYTGDDGAEDSRQSDEFVGVRCNLDAENETRQGAFPGINSSG